MVRYVARCNIIINPLIGSNLDGPGELSEISLTEKEILYDFTYIGVKKPNTQTKEKSNSEKEIRFVVTGARGAGIG